MAAMGADKTEINAPLMPGVARNDKDAAIISPMYPRDEVVRSVAVTMIKPLGVIRRERIKVETAYAAAGSSAHAKYAGSTLRPATPRKEP
jgi:hypothetical protein